jgi:hypothetical protein
MVEGSIRMTRFKRAMFAVLTVGTASACSLIGNLDQFNGAVDEEGGSKGGDADSDRSVKDASSDGQKADAHRGDRDSEAEGGDDGGDTDVPGDDSGDSSIDDGGDASNVDWCVANMTANTTFCRDFDDGQPYNFKFAPYLQLADGGEPPSIVSTTFVSRPSSLLVTTPMISSSDHEQVQLVVQIGNHAHVQLQFALKLVDYDLGVGDLSLARIAFGNSDWWVSLDLQGSSSANVYETTVTDGNQMTVTHPTSMPALGKWVNVVFTVDVDAETVALTYDGTNVLQNTIAAPTPAGSLDLSSTIGINYLQGPAQPMSIYYDNVAIVAP